jgi:hypothetical protein
MKNSKRKYRKQRDPETGELDCTNRLNIIGSTIYWELIVLVNSKKY